MCIGVTLVITRRNLIMMLIGIELMLNASNLNLIAFGKKFGQTESHLFVLFILLVAAAEISIALALLIQFYKHFQSSHLEN